uniref:Uncharacterized protein n=1 Tax=Acrobeloides nanus TaxID=290746 RepID=A0A914C566_9BILA
MSNSTNIEPPKVQDWLQNANSSDIVILIIATVSSSFVCTIGMAELYFVIKYIRREDIRRNLLWIVLMLPITTSLATIGMFFPRSSLFLYILGIW